MMKKMFFACTAALVVTAVPMLASAEAPASAAVAVASGTRIYSADGRRIGNAYGAPRSGKVALILDGKMAYIPAATLSIIDGKVTTTMTRAELSRQR